MQTTLAGMYGTDIPFLESPPISVIKRKFNFIPTGGKGDPPRELTALPPVGSKQTLPYTTVKSNFPQTLAYREYGTGFAQFPDGTYRDAVRGIDRDYVERQENLKQVFKQPDAFAFMRADREQSLANTIRDFFTDRTEARREDDRIFLEEFGLSEDETRQVLSDRRVRDAATALDSLRTRTSMPLRPTQLNIRREDMQREDRIAELFMDTGMPLISADDTRGAGNLQPRAIGHEDYRMGQMETDPAFRSVAARRRQMTAREESGARDAIKALRAAAQFAKTKAGERMAAPTSAEIAFGRDTKADVVRQFAKETDRTFGEADTRLKEIMRSPAGRPSLKEMMAKRDSGK